MTVLNQAEITSEITAAIDACNRANVAIYPVDVRGLTSNTMPFGPRGAVLPAGRRVCAIPAWRWPRGRCCGSRRCSRRRAAAGRAAACRRVAAAPGRWGAPSGGGASPGGGGVTRGGRRRRSRRRRGGAAADPGGRAGASPGAGAGRRQSGEPGNSRQSREAAITDGNFGAAAGIPTIRTMRQ